MRSQHIESPTATTPTLRNPTAAFSLIEVVIAVALFAMATTVLSSSFVNALLAREKSQSNDLRNADISAVRLQLLLEPNLDAAEDGALYETLNNGNANWRADIEPLDVVDLFRADFSIEFLDPQEGQDPNHQETLYLLRPSWSEPEERAALLEDKKASLLDSRSFGRF